MKYRSSQPPTSSSASRRSQTAAPDTQSTSRAASGAASSWRYFVVNGFVGQNSPSAPCITATEVDGIERADG